MAKQDLKKDSITRALSGDYEGSQNYNDAYYVYMLCSKTTKTPFYIGKGTKDRVWAHEKETNEFEKNIREELEAEIKANNDLTLDEINTFINNQIPSDKCAEIARRLKSDDLEAVIVKYGLTEKEALMAESALINMNNYTSNQPLTNIVNGHMSNREKCNRSRKTEALSLYDFQKQCGIEELSLSTLDTASKKGEKINVAFIKINQLYPHCKNEQDPQNAIYDATRGYWPISPKKLSQIDYIFSLYQSQIVQIYPLFKHENAWSTRKDIEKISINNKMATDNNNTSLPIFPYSIREREYYWHNKSVEAKWNYKTFKELLSSEELKEFQSVQLKNEKTTQRNGKKFKVKKTDAEFEKSYQNWSKKFFFEIPQLTEEQKEEFEHIKAQYLGKLLCENQKKIITTQRSVTFNF